MPRAGAWWLLAATIGLSVCGQLLLKWQVGKSGAGPVDASGLVQHVVRLLLNPWILGALAAAFLASLLWMLALTRLDLSEAYPYTALSFILILFMSYLLFGEPLTAGKVIGTCFVACGIIVIALTD